MISSLKNPTFVKNALFFALACHLFRPAIAAQQYSEYSAAAQNYTEKYPLRPYISPVNYLTVDLKPGKGDAFSLSFDNTQPSKINYLLDGSPVAQLLTNGHDVSFESLSPQQKHNFSLVHPLKAGMILLKTQGKFTFEQPVDVESAKLECEVVELPNHGEFSSVQECLLAVQYVNNNGHLKCSNFSFQGDRLNCMPGSSVTVSGLAFISALKGFFNAGKFSCAQKTVVETSSFRNLGSVETEGLSCTGDKVVNVGLVTVQDSFWGECKTFDNQSKWNVKNNFLLNSKELFSKQNSRLYVGGDLKAAVTDLDLNGCTSVENLALFNVGEHATFNGPFHARILYLDSKGLITCHPHAEFVIAHHLGLKAKGFITYAGEVFEKSLNNQMEKSSGQKIDPLLKIFPHGIFLYSEKSGLKKSGTIVAKGGTVSLGAKGRLTHVGLTDAGFHKDSQLLMNAEDLILEKQSVLKSGYAQLIAKNNLYQSGSAKIMQQLQAMGSHVTLHGVLDVGDILTIQGDDILASASSMMRSKMITLEVEEKISNQGVIEVEKQLAVKAATIDLGQTSCVKAPIAYFEAKEKISNQGIIKAEKQLAIRSNVVTNYGSIEAKNAQINANEMWWNAGKVSAQEGLTIQATTSINTWNSVINARDYRRYCKLGFEVGSCTAQNRDLNSLIVLNLGIIRPGNWSFKDDVFTKSNILAVGQTVGMMGVPYFCPPVGAVIGGGLAAYGLAQVPGRWAAISKDEEELHKMGDVEASDLLPIYCRKKDLAISTLTSVKTVWRASTAYGECWDYYNKPIIKAPAAALVSDVKTLSVIPAKTPAASVSAVFDVATTFVRKASKEKNLWTAGEVALALAPKELHWMHASYAVAKFGRSTYRDWNKFFNSMSPSKAEQADAPAPFFNPDFGANWKTVKALAPGLIGMLDINQYQDALLNLDFSSTLGVNGRSRSLLAMNGGSSLFAGGYALDTVYGLNTGTLGAMNLNINAAKRYTTGLGSLLCGITGSVTAENIDVHGRINMVDRVSLHAAKKVRVGAHVSSKSTNIKGSDVVLQKESQISGGASSVVADNDIIDDGNIDVTGQSVLKAGKNVRIGDKIYAGNSHIQGKDVVLKKESQMSGGASFVVANDIIAEGKINLDYLGLEATNKVAASGETQVGTAFIKGKEVLLKESHSIKAVSSGDQQKLGLVVVRGDNVTNYGSIEAKNAQINANEMWWNAGKVSAKEGLTIKATKSINTWNSVINARDYRRYCKWGFEVGSCTAQNKDLNSLIALNLGVIRSGDWSFKDDVFTKDNILAAGQTVGMMGVSYVCPPVGKVIGGALAAYGLVQAPGRWAAIRKDEEELHKMGNVEASDLLPIYCRKKDLAISTLTSVVAIYNAGTACSEAWDYYNKPPIDPLAASSVVTFPIDPSNSSLFTEKNMWTVGEVALALAPKELHWVHAPFAVAKFGRSIHRDWNKLFNPMAPSKAKQADAPAPFFNPDFGANWNTVKALAPGLIGMLDINQSQDALLNLDFSSTLGVNGRSRSLLAMNGGSSLFAGGYALDTVYGLNTGTLGAMNLNINAAKRYTTGLGSLLCGITGSVTAENIDVHGRINMVDRVSLHAAKKVRINKDATVKARFVAMIAPSLEGAEGNAITSTEHTYMRVAELANKGAVKGVTVLDFTGPENQLHSIGTIDNLHYSGTVENGLPDRLAHGHGELLNINSGGSLILRAGNEGIQIKEEHDINHTFQAKTTGEIRADKPMVSRQGSIGLHADKTVTHDTVLAKHKVDIDGSKVFAQSTVERQGDKEILKQVVVSGGDSTYVRARNGPIDYKGVKVVSGKGGTLLRSDKGKVIADVVNTENHIEKHYMNKKTGGETRTKETSTTSHVSEFISEGGVFIQAGDTCELQGTKFDAQGGVFVYGANGVNGYDAHDTYKRESDYKKDGGWFRTSKESHLETATSTAKPVTFKGNIAPTITSDKIISLSCKNDAPTITLNAPEVHYLLSKDVSCSDSTSKGNNLFWQSEGSEQRLDITARSMFTGTINTNAQKFYIEQKMDGRAPTIVHTGNTDGEVIRTLFDDIHEGRPVVIQGPTKAASVVIAMALTLATAGVGSAAGATVAASVGCKSAITTAMVTKMTAATITSVSVLATDALLRNGGDIEAAARSLANTDTLKFVALSVATGGAMAGVGQAFNQMGLPPVQNATNFGQRLIYAAPREIANAAIRTGAGVASGQKLKDAAVQNLRYASAGTVGTACASQIGDAYAKGKIDPVTHKLLHTAVGAAEGAIIGGRSGAVAGGLGAAVAETFADLSAPAKPSIEKMKELEVALGRPFTQEEFMQCWDDQARAYQQSVSSTAASSQLAAATVALLARQEVAIASNTAATAIDNNFLVLVGYGVVVAGVAYSAYNVYSAYEAEGAPAACKQLGIEVIVHAAGHVAGRVAYKVGKVVYPTAKAAVDVVLESNPGLRTALGSMTDKIIVGIEKVNQTAIGKAVNKVEAALLEQESKFLARLGFNCGSAGESELARHEMHVAAETLGSAESSALKSASKEAESLSELAGHEGHVAAETLSSVESSALKSASKEAESLSELARREMHVAAETLGSVEASSSSSALRSEVARSGAYVETLGSAEASALKGASKKTVRNEGHAAAETPVGRPGSEIQWVDYRKHQPPKNVPWKDLLISTKNGKALYKQGVNIKDLEMNAWRYGKQTSNGKNWKVFKAEQIIGANSGKETCYMRVECSANSIHGHPILESQYLELIK